jgi:hypothetical protein
MLGNGRSVVWKTERFCFAPAKHAATARDRDGVLIARRDRNHHFTLEGPDPPRRILIRFVTVPEPSRPSAAPREELD